MYEGEESLMAQSEMGCKAPEEFSLIRNIDNSTKELVEGLRSVESLTENINKRLLPSMEKPVSGESKCEQAPNGWLETHLADLRVATHKIIKIIEKLEKLSWATKTDVK